MSGFVFAGFGKSEVFPSLFHYEADGIIARRLKTRLSENISTSREKISARVLPFAQRDVVDRFLAGIDPLLQEGIVEYLSTALDKTKATLLSGVKGVSSRSKSEIEANLSESLGVFVNDFGPWLEKVKKAYSKETEDMILFMAKPEAAHLAEVPGKHNIVEAKYSAGEESVAGPIDVAVISRSDGFVWVKRKHYFPAELNPRYFVKKFGDPMSGKRGGDATKTN